MEKQKEKIMRFSKVIHILLKVAFIALIVVAVLEGFACLWSELNLSTEVVTISGVEAELPVLFRLGSVNVFLPIAWKPGYNFWGESTFYQVIPEVGYNDFILTIISIIGIAFAKVVFKLLGENGSPFRSDVIKALKKLTIALLIVGAATGTAAFLSAGITWVLCLIFDYGRALQEESDTTL